MFRNGGLHGESSLRRFLTGLIVLAVLGTAFGSTPASPQTLTSLGAAHRGPGASLRVQVERVRLRLAEDPVAGAAAAKALLYDLRPRFLDPDDPIDPDTLLAVVEEVATLRANALLSADPPTSEARRAFLEGVAGAATVSDWRYGIPASITLAQAILESGWGSSAPGHNLFGMKGEGPAGSTASRVVEYKRGRRVKQTASFRLYRSPGESIADHGRLLGTSRRYARARAAGDDVDAFARSLVGVYATDPRYAAKLTRLVAANGLDRFDLAGGPWG